MLSPDPGDHLQADHVDQRVRRGDLAGHHGGGVHREGAQRQVQDEAAGADPHRGHHGESVTTGRSDSG